MGRVLPTPSRFTFADKEADVVIATDGTVKDGQGGAAYSIHTTETLGTIKSIIPVDGSPRHLTSYRTELLAILGALLLLHKILTAEEGHWQNLTAVLW